MDKNMIASKSFGIVVYMDNKSYSDKISNTNIHFPITKEQTAIQLFKAFYDIGLGKYEVENIVIGHEHGEENNKCHMQIYLKFTEKIRKYIKPGSFIANNTTFLYMTQKCKTPAKMRNYCKKDKCFIESFPCKTIKDILREENIIDELTDVDDPYDTLFHNKNLNDEQIVCIFKTCNVTEYKKDFLCNSKKIIETYNKYMEENKENIPEFKWNFPKHMYDYIEHNFGNTDKTMLAYSKIYSWFKEYCEPDKYLRRKALFLFSLAGGVGKSYFARSLVPEISPCNSPYYVYCRGTLDATEFIKKSKYAKLIILDDVNYISNDIEIWKALTVSEPTNIRTPYHNIPWMKSLPCIMMSNNIKTLKYWMETEDLKSRCVFVSVDFYIGPPGTDNEENHKVNSFLTDDVKTKLQDGIFTSLFKK
jgi:hypothetical protein